jgi:hypothetical protein
MKETLARIGEWVKSHPIPSAIIALVLIVGGVYLYNRSKTQSASAPAGTGITADSTAGGLSGGGGVSTESALTTDPITFPDVPSYPTVSYTAAPTWTPVGNYSQTPGAITAPQTKEVTNPNAGSYQTGVDPVTGATITTGGGGGKETTKNTPVNTGTQNPITGQTQKTSVSGAIGKDPLTGAPIVTTPNMAPAPGQYIPTGAKEGQKMSASVSKTPLAV